MTNLPITASTPQNVAPGKQSSNANENADASVQPFGEVLARQISAPDVKVAKPDDKLAVELAAQTVTETTDLQKDDKALPETAATLPTDMLAALIPQVMNGSAAASAAGAAGTTATPATNAKTDATLAVTSDKPGKATAKADPAAVLQTAASVKTEQPAVAATRNDAVTSFAATLGELAARTTSSLRAETTARDMVAAPAAPTAAAAMNAMQNSAVVTAPLVQTTQLKIDTPVSQPRWGDEFSQKITWLARPGIDQSAELHLNPPQLGPVDVVIKVSGDQATALFTSPHAAVREAVEQAIPRLRDMMADNGITLGNTTVSDQAPRDQGKPEGQRAVQDSGNDRSQNAIASSNSARVSPITRHNGIVDTFA